MTLPFDQERPIGTRGFSLVELLVAMAVLSLLVVMLAQMVALTSQAISIDSKKIDAAGQARLVFDRLASDLASMPSRPDFGMMFTKAAGNDSFQFYSQVDGYSGARQIAAVGYRIQQSTPGRLYQLERGAVGTDWGPSITSNPLVQFLPNTQAIATNTDPNYDVLASGVFRLEFCYVLTTGQFYSPPNNSTSPYVVYCDNPTGAAFYNGNPTSSKIAAVVIAVGILDTNSQKLISSNQLGQLATALPDNTSGDDPIADWNTAMAKPTFAPAGIPAQVVQNIRFYERTFYVP